MSDGAAWSSFNLPFDPPWFCDTVARAMPPVETGNNRRPLMHPPPKHIRGAGPVGLELASSETGQVELKRLEDQAREDKRREGLIVYDDTAPYQVRGKWDEAEGGDPNSLSSVRTLQFESRFESGNLQRAMKIGAAEYDLYLRPDKGSGQVQWYYFMVRNMKNGVPYTFNIMNLVKNKSLYNSGLQPLLYSDKEARNRRIGVGWQRTGSKCAYYQRGNRFTLTFSLSFKHEGDTCFLSHCYPYTYTDCQIFLNTALKDPAHNAVCKRTELCRSLAGNVVDLLEISENVHVETATPVPLLCSCLSMCQNECKPSILLSARVHPGETQGSWAVQSCIEFLMSNLPEAKLLRSRFILYVVPMLNPDGVINGHYRCSMSGQDLNRLWANPDKAKHPCIWHIRELVRNLSTQGLTFFCDFHGHSVKKNAFMYGCSDPGNQSYKPSSTKSIPASAMFPLLLEEISPAFSFYDSNFRVQRSKQNTGRVVVNREFGVKNSYTLEISFLGHQVEDTMAHFKIEDLEKMGSDFAVALVKYYFPTQYDVTKSSKSSPSSPTGGRLEKEAGTEKRSEVGSGPDFASQGVQDIEPSGSISARPHAAARISPAIEQKHDGRQEILINNSPIRSSALQNQHLSVAWDDDCQDNFVRSGQSRRDMLAHEIRQCKADLEQLSPSLPDSRTGRVIQGDGAMHIEEQASKSPTRSPPPGIAVRACGNESDDESDHDSDDSSDDGLMPDSESTTNTGNDDGEECPSDEDSESTIDPDIAKWITEAKFAQPFPRAGVSLTTLELLEGCNNGFLPKLEVKKFNGNSRESKRSRPGAAPAMQLAAALRVSGLMAESKPDVAEALISVHPQTPLRETTHTVECIGAGKYSSKNDSNSEKGSEKANFELRGFRAGHDSNDGKGENPLRASVQHMETASAPAGSHRSLAGTGHNQYAEDRLDRHPRRAAATQSSSASVHTFSPAPKLAQLCAAVEFCHAPPDRHRQFPNISSMEYSHRSNFDAGRADATNGVKFTVMASGARGTDACQQPPARRVSTSGIDPDLQRLAQRLGNVGVGDLCTSTDLHSLYRHESALEGRRVVTCAAPASSRWPQPLSFSGSLTEVPSSLANLASQRAQQGPRASHLQHLRSASPASLGLQKQLRWPSNIVDSGDDAGYNSPLSGGGSVLSSSNPHHMLMPTEGGGQSARVRQMRAAKGRPARVAAARTQLSRPGAPQTKSRRNTTAQATEGILSAASSLTIVTAPRDVQVLGSQMDSHTRAGRGRIHSNTATQPSSVYSASPRRAVAGGYEPASTLYENPYAKFQAHDHSSITAPSGSPMPASKDNLTFIRMLSVLKRKPD